MIYPLLPVFLKSLGGTAAALGWMEGIAEGLSALVKWQSGKWSDRATARKPFIVAGYTIASLSRPLMGLATSPWHVVLLRSFDRIGKGIRGAPRDALIASSIEPGRRGAAFGFHRMMDNLGSVLGPIIAFVLLKLLALPLWQVFALAIIPGLCSIFTLVFGVKEVPAEQKTQSKKSDSNGRSINEKDRNESTSHQDTSATQPTATDATQAREPDEPLPASAKGFLAATALFTLGASADSFLLLHASALGLSDAYLPILWLSLAAARAATNVPGGHLGDRIGSKRVLVAGWVVYALSYSLFSQVNSIGWYWGLVLFYGVYYGLTEGSEKALLADLVSPAQRGRAYGALHAITGLCVLPANAMFGALYLEKPTYAFVMGAGFAALGAIVLLLTRLTHHAEATG